MEGKHRISKTASEEFWELAKSGFVKLSETRNRQFITKKIPKFRTVRDNIYEDRVPKIHMSVAYQHKDTGDIIVMEDLESTPRSRFPPTTYSKLYETAKVKVFLIL